VGAWLDSGLTSISRPLSDYVAQSSTTRDIPPKKFQPVLTTSHSLTPTIGRRELVSPKTPLSPMNNGRDAYGNYIPTNMRDYLITQSPPTSPTLQSIQEEAMPYLRGGAGGWWGTLGIGQAGKEQTSTFKTGSSRRGAPAQDTENEYSFVSQDQLSINSGSTDVQSQAVGGCGSVSADSERNANITLVDDWPDDSDYDIFGFKHKRLMPTKFEPIGNSQLGSVQDRRQGRSKGATPSAPGSHLLTHSTSTHERTVLAIKDGHRSPSRIGIMPGAKRGLHTTFDGLNQPKARFNTRIRSGSPMSDISSYGARDHKRWDKGPATGPPAADALPPSPPKDILSKDEVVGSIGLVSTCKDQNKPTPSVAELYDDEAWELQSLLFGDSASLARHGLRCTSRQGTYEPTTGGFEASQKKAQAKFRPLCHEIMTLYNAEIYKYDRAHQRNEITLEQYKMHVEWNVQNKNKALEISAGTCGYLVSVYVLFCSVISENTLIRERNVANKKTDPHKRTYGSQRHQGP
jgi:hypothetical protein